MTPPSWQPDPTGRNQYRWWDGTAWASQVSNNGQVGDDPLTPVVAPPVATPPATFGAPPAPGAAAGFGGQAPGAAVGAPSTPSGNGKLLKILIPVVAVVALVVVLFVVVGGGDDESSSGLGVTEIELPDTETVATVKMKFQRGDVVRVRIESEENYPMGAVIASDEISEAFLSDYDALIQESEFADFVTDIDEFFSDVDDLFTDSDLESLGDLDRATAIVEIEGEEGLATEKFPILVSGEYTLVVGSDNGALGEVRIIVEKADEGIDEDALGSYEDIDDFMSDDDNDFVANEDFFSDDAPYTP